MSYSFGAGSASNRKKSTRPASVPANARARSDPRTLLEELRLPVVFDEIQHVPELLAYVRTRIDQDPREMGRWLFTGSQEAPWMQGVSESMAGRAAILQLPPFSLSLLHGGYPAGACYGTRVVVQFLQNNGPADSGAGAGDRGTRCARICAAADPDDRPKLDCAVRAR